MGVVKGNKKGKIFFYKSLQNLTNPLLPFFFNLKMDLFLIYNVQTYKGMVRTPSKAKRKEKKKKNLIY